MIDNLSAMNDVGTFLDLVRRDVDRFLDTSIPAADIEPRRLHEAIRWSVFAGGKRIRPALVFASGQTFGAGSDEVVATAAAIEMIHTYSLIHDDLPAMDDDDLRRGKATCHKEFDEATAILAGDVLQTLAYKTIARHEQLAPETRVELINLIATAAGTPDGMVAGQQLDLEAEGRELAITDIEAIHLKKTGALISASVLAGALIGRASEAELAALREYARHLGLLFQVTDDLLDVTAATESIGKTAGKDAASNKATYPQQLGLVGTADLANDLLDKAHRALSRVSKDTSLLDELGTMVLNRKR
jgi:geranylgeranyl pyrophosphate synthase